MPATFTISDCCGQVKRIEGDIGSKGVGERISKEGIRLKSLFGLMTVFGQEQRSFGWALPILRLSVFSVPQWFIVHCWASRQCAPAVLLPSSFGASVQASGTEGNREVFPTLPFS